MFGAMETDDIVKAIYDFAHERGYRMGKWETPERIAQFGDQEVANRVEEREGPFSCPFCGPPGRYSWPASLVRHIADRHPVITSA